MDSSEFAEHLSPGSASIGFLVSHTSIRRLLKQLGYSLKANRKSVATTQHPQRDQQFRYLERVKEHFIKAGHPVQACRYQEQRANWEFQKPWARVDSASRSSQRP
ncbi:hypothetical protein [Moorena sp. SIO4G3]|uniref:ISAzo13-like element transposase-related protein n=1 Tax=Moorena sp. SIO4G3 TaxID=2607821 RepID=UPI00142A4994|nr:hypothetical protein [Moorena sp. SIO4G3]